MGPSSGDGASADHHRIRVALHPVPSAAMLVSKSVLNEQLRSISRVIGRQLVSGV